MHATVYRCRCSYRLAWLSLIYLYLPEWYFWVIGEAPQDKVLILSLTILIVCPVVDLVILRVKVLHGLQHS